MYFLYILLTAVLISVVMCTKWFILILILEQNKSFPHKNMILTHIHVFINGRRDEVTGTVP